MKWVTIPEYQKMTNLTRPNIKRLIDDGQLVATRTDGGQMRIKVDENQELEELAKKIEVQEQMLRLLCNHLGVKQERW